MTAGFIERWKRKKKVEIVRSDAPERVLSTYELLEPILLHLNPASLRAGRIVSKTWNAVITRSKILDAKWQLAPRKPVEPVKVMVFGEGGTGKKTLLGKYGDMGAPDPYDPTFDYYEAVRKSLTIDGKKWMVEANDFHWRDDWVAGFVHWVRAMDCYVLVYSSTSRDSFYSLRMWSAKIRAIQDMSDASLVRQREPAILVAVVATKCDLRDARAVSTAEGIDLARELGCPFYETSRVARNEIDRVWEAIGRTWWNGTIAKDPQGARPTAACKAGECERESSRRWSMHRRLRSFHRRLVGSSEQ